MVAPDTHVVLVAIRLVCEGRATTAAPSSAASTMEAEVAHGTSAEVATAGLLGSKLEARAPCAPAAAVLAIGGGQRVATAEVEEVRLADLER